jgi:hypothetical protein
MGKSLRLVLALVFCSALAIAQTDIACTPTTPVPQQSRTKLKHRMPPAPGVIATIIVREMLLWAAPAGVASSPAIRASNTPIDPKETQIFTVAGDLWRTVIEGNDCDIHLELTEPGAGPTADRIIAEVPQGSAFVPIRTAILKQLADQGISFPAPLLKNPIPIHVTGYAFYDAFHFTRSDPKRSNGHGTAFVGTMWELHPVWSVTF